MMPDPFSLSGKSGKLALQSGLRVEIPNCSDESAQSSAAFQQKQLSFSLLLNTNESCFIQDQLNRCCQEASEFSSDSLQKTPKGTICWTNRIFASSGVSV